MNTATEPIVQPWRWLLWPFSLLYASVIYVRNRFYDLGLLTSKSGALPSVVIGNLAAGGTGKTPHTEWLLENLHPYRAACLSRGYGRSSRGFLLYSHGTNAEDFGDEPSQIAHKFSDKIVAVCEDRLLGISMLKKQTASELVILDDAFQHRRLKADYNILLTSWQRPYWSDAPLPVGYLRDNKRERQRAQAIIVTKCPETITAQQMAEAERLACIRPEQQLHFTTVQYGAPIWLSGPQKVWKDGKPVIGFAGIAQPHAFREHLMQHFKPAEFRAFPDHHIFSQKDLLELKDSGNKFDRDKQIWITTEKDAMRLRHQHLPDSVSIFYLPIKVMFLTDPAPLLSAIDLAVRQHTVKRT